MATDQPYTRLIMKWGGARSEIHKQLIVNNDQSSPELFVNTYKEICISLDSLCSFQDPTLLICGFHYPLLGISSSTVDGFLETDFCFV